jgi:hypothetical protein
MKIGNIALAHDLIRSGAALTWIGLLALTISM